MVLDRAAALASADVFTTTLTIAVRRRRSACGLYGGDLRGTGAANSARLRPDGSVVPRNGILAPAQNRTDLRVQQRIPLGGPFAIDAIAEVFNMFDRHNYEIGTVESVRAQYLQPVSAPTRTMQFGFRLTF